MPGIFDHSLSRRAFLINSGRAAATLELAGEIACLRAAQGNPQRPVHLALISDTHVAADPASEYRKFRPWDNLKRVVSQIQQARPEGVILDGDAARLTGEVEDYQAVRQLLNPLAEKLPVWIGLGNHDNRVNFENVFVIGGATVQNVKDKHVLVLEWPALRVVLLDSLLYVNHVAGLLGKAQRLWLDQFLARCDTRPTVLFVHHTLGDNDGELLDAAALFEIVRPYRKVKAIFYGHSHEYAYAQEHAIHLVNLPAVGYNFADKEPVGWVDAHFSADGVALTLHAFGGNRQKDGQTTSLAWR